ncbi:hypothetical protein [Chryseobacterium sp. c4a]|uniref:hypothetical protein n=1 Tax=Chryseobacterium sp. c4a TaxID=1573582 RepID=UPI00135C221B|nr:hypothetical protein [Chryseobacterium sp. c4a]
MKKSTVQKKKLTKKEMKTINGAGTICPIVFSCIDHTGNEQYGVYGIQDGPCC